MSCDNLPANGRRLKASVCALAARQDADLAAWIEHELPAPNTMVDAITPATDDALRARVAGATGLHDDWPVQRERFAQWVIEAHANEGGPDWAQAGAIVAADVAPFERAKLWMLNGVHSTLAYLGLLGGHQTVAQAIADPELDAFVAGYMNDDISPLLGAPDFDPRAYGRSVLARLRNPAMQHRLAQIAQDGSIKLPVRIVEPLRQAHDRGADIARFAVPLAAWMRFLRICARDEHRIVDMRSNELQGWAASLRDDLSDVEALMSLPGLLPPELAHSSVLRHALQDAYLRLLDRDASLRI